MQNHTSLLEINVRNTSSPMMVVDESGPGLSFLQSPNFRHCYKKMFLMSCNEF